jgi:NAD(P)-dependent dehydrogenase (short-subunit alcohol dehydrogenase family)
MCPLVRDLLTGLHAKFCDSPEARRRETPRATQAAVGLMRQCSRLDAVCTSCPQHRHRLEDGTTTAREEWTPAHAYTCDVSDKNQVERLAQLVLQDLGRVDILVQSVGTRPIPHMEATEVVVDAISMNLLSHYWVSTPRCMALTVDNVGR